MCEGSGNSQCSTQILLDPFIPCTVAECSLFQQPPPKFFVFGVLTAHLPLSLEDCFWPTGAAWSSCHRVWSAWSLRSLFFQSPICSPLLKTKGCQAELCCFEQGWTQPWYIICTPELPYRTREGWDLVWCGFLLHFFIFLSSLLSLLLVFSGSASPINPCHILFHLRAVSASGVLALQWHLT